MSSYPTPGPGYNWQSTHKLTTRGPSLICTVTIPSLINVDRPDFQVRVYHDGDLESCHASLRRVVTWITSYPTQAQRAILAGDVNLVGQHESRPGAPKVEACGED